MTLARKAFVLILCCFASVMLEDNSAFGFQAKDSAETTIDLIDANFTAWRDCIKAKKSELVWRDLPWLPSYHQGLIQAGVENKPLLLWAMNGHPMGCT